MHKNLTAIRDIEKVIVDLVPGTYKFNAFAIHVMQAAQLACREMVSTSFCMKIGDIQEEAFIFDTTHDDEEGYFTVVFVQKAYVDHHEYTISHFGWDSIDSRYEAYRNAVLEATKVMMVDHIG